MAELEEQALSAARRHIIERPRLTRLLDETSARVIMLVAPAGYGKTTLARQWLANRPHAWFQATAAHSDVVALAAALAETLAVGTSDSVVARARTLRQYEASRTLAELQVEALRSWPRDAWLAIDDYEELALSAAAEDYLSLVCEM